MSSPLVRLRASASFAAQTADVLPDIESLYRQHAEDVARWAGRLAGQGFDIEDLVHQVFLVVQRRLPQFRGEAKVTTWMHEITIRVVQEARRKQRRWLVWPRSRTHAANSGTDHGSEDQVASLPSDQLTPLELLEKKEAGRMVYEILDQLDEKYRTALILFELEGLSGQEIAAVTRISQSNVWVRLLRARQQFLKRFLERDAEAGRAAKRAKAAKRAERAEKAGERS
jgi:RNA polymerase sigma-70 factor (ECF subfamily)